MERTHSKIDEPFTCPRNIILNLFRLLLLAIPYSWCLRYIKVKLIIRGKFLFIFRRSINTNNVNKQFKIYYLSVCMSICLSINTCKTAPSRQFSVDLFQSWECLLFVYLSICLSVCVYLSVSICLCLSVCMSICLSISTCKTASSRQSPANLFQRGKTMLTYKRQNFVREEVVDIGLFIY